MWVGWARASLAGWLAQVRSHPNAMTSSNGLLYRRFLEAFKKKNPSLQRLTAASEATEEWKRARAEHPVQAHFEEHINQLIDTYLMEASTRKGPRTKVSHSPLDFCSVPQDPLALPDDDKCSSEDELNAHGKRKYTKPSQETSLKRIYALEQELNRLTQLRETNGTDDSLESQIRLTRVELEEERKALSKKERNAQRQKKFRETFKTKIKAACAENPGMAVKLKIRDGPGRPRLEENQPELLKAIVDIAVSGKSEEERHNADKIRSCKTLDSLHQELLKAGFSISRSATYLRLQPQNSQTREGKRHVATVPVTLNDSKEVQKGHPDQEFCAASLQYIDSLASILGPKEVFYLAQDHRARVSLGMTAPCKQAPLLMRMEYNVCFPDTQSILADQQKLIPSVYGGVVINSQSMGDDQAVLFSGPTYVAIRTGSQGYPTAEAHAADFDRLLHLENFRSMAKNEHGAVKPIVILSVNGGPDESARNAKQISFAIKHFRDYDLDALFLVNDAPGQSASNRAERRLATMSHQLSDLVIPHDRCGSHLDEEGRTINKELQVENFACASRILAEVWNSTVIDGHNVVAEQISGVQWCAQIEENADWYCRHVRESQYLLQVVKCGNPDCCGMLRSSLRCILPQGFLPPPCKLWQSSSGLIATERGDHAKFCPLFVRLSLQINPSLKNFVKTPYDYFCPSIVPFLADRTCSMCGIYFASKKGVVKHKELVHGMFSEPVQKAQPACVLARRGKELLCLFRDDHSGAEDAEWIDEDEVDTDVKLRMDSDTPSQIPIVASTMDWLSSPWTNFI